MIRTFGLIKTEHTNIYKQNCSLNTDNSKLCLTPLKLLLPKHVSALFVLRPVLSSSVRSRFNFKRFNLWCHSILQDIQNKGFFFLPAVWGFERTGSKLCLLAVLGEVNRKAMCLSKKSDPSCSMGCTDVGALCFTAGFLNYCCIMASDHRGTKVLS